MWLAVKGSYRSVEKVFLTACVFYLAYVAAGFLVRPDWLEVVSAVAAPTAQGRLSVSGYARGAGRHDDRAVDAVLSSSFYCGQRSGGQGPAGYTCRRYCRLSRGKRGGIFHYPRLRCHLVQGWHKDEKTAEQAALALRPLAGPYCAWLFAFGLFNASMFAAAILPLSTAYTVCEAFGWESSWIRSFPKPRSLRPLLFYDFFLGARYTDTHPTPCCDHVHFPGY